MITICTATAFSAHAQLRQQTIPLQPGWNAVYLEVQPEPRDPASVFAGLPIESVWDWNPNLDTEPPRLSQRLV